MFTPYSKQATKEDVTTIESEFGFVFPKEYRDFVLAGKVGKPTKTVTFKYFKSDAEGDDDYSLCDINLFFPLVSVDEIEEGFSFKPNHQLIAEIVAQDDIQKVIADVVLIALCSDEEMVLSIGIREYNMGEIYLSHADGQNLSLFMEDSGRIKVADDFNQFLNKLTEETE